MKTFTDGERLFAEDLNDNFDETKTAGNILSGTFNVARIPNLDAAKTTTGTFDVARIPKGVGPSFSASTAATETLDFATGDEVIRSTREGALAFAGSNYTAGVSKTIIWNGGTSSRTVSFPAGWVFVSVKPTSLAANKRGVLSVVCHGTAEADVTAAWAFEA